VKGVGVGVTLNETFGGTFLAPFKKLPLLFSHRKSAEDTKRTLLHDFSGSVKDGEMLLVLGRPGSGCSTFLKTLASQTEGYEDVSGEISYGGLTAKEVKEKYRGEVVYNQGLCYFWRTVLIHRGRYSLCDFDREADVGFCVEDENAERTA
jgi:ABC-type multidrug transport system ATPase subunit